MLEQREEGFNDSAPRADTRRHLRRTHSSLSDQTQFRKDGLNTLSAYDTKAGLFGASLTGVEEGHMKIVGEVDQDNEVDDENPQRQGKDSKRASAGHNDEHSHDNIPAVINQKPQEPRDIQTMLPLMDSGDRAHLAHLKKQIIEYSPQDLSADPSLVHPKKL